MAFTEPLLSVLGANPEVFVAEGNSRAEIWTLTLGVAFVIPLVGSLLELGAYAIRHRAGEIVHTVLVGLLGFAVGLVLLRELSVDAVVPAVLGAAVLGVAVAAAENMFRPAQIGLRYLGVAPLLYLASFAFFSKSSDLLWGGQDAEAASVSVEDPAPVVMVVMDAAPLAALVNETGEINRERYPNFARLAEESAWYRNATSPATSTTWAIPGILTGSLPSLDSSASYAYYPDSLFTLLGDAYDVQAAEPMTLMCPPSVCVEQQRGTGWNLSRLRATVEDSAVVWGHVTLPSAWRESLPDIDQGWAGFVGRDDDEEVEARPDPGPRTQQEEFAEFVDGLDTLDERSLHYLHVLLPHPPFELSQSGAHYEPPTSIDLSRAEEGTNLRHWTDDDRLLAQVRQRAAMQLGAADRQLGALLDRLEASPRWDETVLVVTADHGESYEAGQGDRYPENGAEVDDVHRVPLFIRGPGAEPGTIVDEPVSTIDILPTLVDWLGIDTDWDFDGQSLSEPDPDRAPPIAPWLDDQASADLDGLLEAAERFHRDEGGPDWLGLAQVGAHGRLVGEEVTDDAGVGGSAEVEDADRFDDIDLSGDELPVVIEGAFEPDGGAGPDALLVSLNGTIAGVGAFEQAGDGSYRFSAVLAEELFEDGDNRLELFLATGPPTNPTLRPLSLD